MPTDGKPIASVWTGPRRPQREQLTREQIVAAATELLNLEQGRSPRHNGARQPLALPMCLRFGRFSRLGR